MYAAVLAGGSGTRLWPLSTKATPKQFLRLVSERSLLQETVARVEQLAPAAQMYIVTFARYRPTISQQLPALPAQHIIAEPAGRGTAASIGLAAALIAARDPRAIMGCFPADHAIADADRFRIALAVAEEAARDGYLVTLGITPSYAETGYGYIQSGAPLPYHYTIVTPQQRSTPVHAHAVARFVEKPRHAVAEQYLREGTYFWNAGIFVWRVDRILDELRCHVPQVSAVLDDISAVAAHAEGAVTPAVEEALARAWPRLTENVTIDTGVMEHADRIAVIPATIGWNDVGSWAQVAALHAADDRGNSVVGLAPGRALAVQTSDTLIYSTTGRRIATAGIAGLVIVDTPDGILICTKEAAQHVKDLAERAQRSDEP